MIRHTFSLFLCLAALSSRSADTVTPVPFETGRQRAVVEQTELIHLGSGVVTHADLSGELIAVSSARSSHSRAGKPATRLSVGDSLPRTPWYGVSAIDIYRLKSDGSPILLATIPQQYAVQALKLDRTRLYVSDIVGVAAYDINRKDKQVKLAWKYALPYVQQIEYFESFLLLRTEECVQVVEDAGNSCILRTETTLFSKQLARSGERARLFVVGRSGDCILYVVEPSAQFTAHCDIPLFGNVLSVANYAPHQLLVLDDQFGLRLLNTQEFTRRSKRREKMRNPESFDDSRFATETFKKKYLVSELPLPPGQTVCRVFGSRVYLLDAKGKLSTVSIDPVTREFGKLQTVSELDPVAEIAGDEQEQVTVGRNGSIARLREGKVLAQLPSAVEAGAWFEQDGEVYVARGETIQKIEKATWGVEVFRATSPILDIQTVGSQVWLLSEKQLTVAQIEDGKLREIGSLAVPPQSVFLRLGAAYAAVVHGDRGLLLVDIRNPQHLQIASDCQLELPTHSEVPSKGGDNKWFSYKIRDVLLEAKRVFVVGTEVFLYNLDQLAKPDGEVTWKRQWHRPYVSGDDTIYTNKIAPLGGERYLITAYRHFEFPCSRAYVVTMNGDDFAEWRYCRLGAGSAMDAKTTDGLTAIAAGYDGLRLLQLGDTDVYLGSDLEPGEECQAVLVNNDQLYTKSGNLIRRYDYRLEQVQEETAFTFEPTGMKLPQITINDMDVTATDYQHKMGYRNRLKLVETDLSDSAGFPKNVVPQGTVAVDPKLGRIKFADGRNQEPKFLARSEHINVRLAGWRKVGKYVVAALSEQSQGFAVMDLSDPTCMKVLSLTGQPNWSTYPHTVVAERDGYAYITCNIFNCLLPVDMRDPLHPHYERMINLQTGGVPKFSCVTHYSGFFRGDRLFVPGGAGLTEIDVKDPENIQRIAVHEKTKSVHQVLDQERRAIRWLDGQLQFLDITDPANPLVFGTYDEPKDTETFQPLSTVTVDKSTYILAITGRRRKAVQKEILRVDSSDMRHPKLISKLVVAEDAASILPENGYVYVSGNRSFYVVEWREPASPRLVAKLDEPAFLGTWRYSYLDDEPRTTVVAGGEYGLDLQIELKDGNTIWMSGTAASYAVDISDPTQPKVVGSGPGFGESHWIRSDDSDIVSIGCFLRAFIDIGNPLKPRCLMEYYHGHATELGTPSNSGGMYQVGAESIWKWDRDEKTGMFRPEPGVRLPMWLGPDTQQLVNGRPACLITGGHLKTSKVGSAIFEVTPGETLIFNGNIRTVVGTDLSFTPSSFDTPDSIVTIAVVRKDGKSLWRIINQKDDGLWHPMQKGFTVPNDVTQLSLEIWVRGHAWVSDLQLLRGEENLLKNPGFDQPLDDQGLHPHWPTVQPAGQRFNENVVDDDCLYLPQGRDLLIYDLKKKGRFPVTRIAAGIHQDHDGPVNILVSLEGDRKIAYAVTYQGLVTIDVTDPYHPFRLGALSVPWLHTATMAVSRWRNCLILVPGFTSDPLTEGFYVIDISDPSRPYLRSSVSGRHHSGVACHNGYLYLGDYSQGMQIWDITNPDRPRMITDQGYQRCSQIWEIDLHGDHVLRNEVGGLELWEAPVLAAVT